MLLKCTNTADHKQHLSEYRDTDDVCVNESVISSLDEWVSSSLMRRYQRVCSRPTFVYPRPVSQHTREFPVRLSNWLSLQSRHEYLWRFSRHYLQHKICKLERSVKTVCRTVIMPRNYHHHHHHHHHHQFIGSKTWQSNTCKKTNRAGQQGHWCH